VKTQELQDKWIDDTEEHITEVAVSASSAKVLPANTVLVAMYGATVGQLGLLRRPMTCNQACSALVVDPKAADFRFVFYQLLQARSQLQSLATGAAQQNLSGALIKSLRFPYPPVSEQRLIAHILGTLDDKIELNRRMNETLEAMARALFKSWFVDFDPVAAKAEGRDTGLPAEIADLFPDSFEESELGPVPAGWKVGSVDSIASTAKDSLLPGRFPAKTWEHYSIPAFDNGRVPVMDTGATIKSGKYRVPPTCVLVSKLNPQFPRVWYPTVQDVESAICSTEFIPFVPRHPEWRSYLYEMMKSDLIQHAIAERVTGSTGSRQRAKPDDIASIPIVVPSRKPLDLYCRLASRIHQRISAAIGESRTLAATRDALLPKLISGELRVGDAEGLLSGVPL
jgi:type I restriction enzyme S subunit